MKVILLAAISIDGKIAQSEEQISVDWTSKEDTKFFIKKTKESGVVIMGRKTFDTIGKPLKDRKIVVMTRDVNDKTDLDGVSFTDKSASEIIQDLRGDGCESVVVAGGASIYELFLKEGLITDLYLTIEPVVFGGGVDFVKNISRLDLKLVDVSRLGEKAVLVHYHIV